jgi:hypothetical protein
MSGLYDSPVGALDPRSMMLMQMGMGLMRGPSMTPISFGQSLGQAGQQGLQAFQQTQQANQQAQMMQMKMAEEQRQAAERQKREAAMAELSKDPRFAGMGALLQVAPQVAIDRAIPKPKEQESPFGKVTPDKYTPESWTKFVQTRNYADLVSKPDEPKDDGFSKALKAAGIVEGSPQWIAAHQSRVQKLTTHAPASSAVVKLPPQEKKFDEAVGKEFGEMYSNLLKADMNVPATVTKYERLGSLLSQVNTGKFTGTTVELKAMAKGLGIDLNSLGVADNVAPAQAAKSLSNQLALELRNPAGGAGMPGALSDQDRQFLLQMIPSLESDPGAVKQMIDYRVKLARREQQVARMARDYRRKNGRFDEGFFDELKEWSDKNNLFPEAPKTDKGGWSITPK